MNYPTLVRIPSYPIEVSIEDAVLRSDTDSGHVITRPKFTKSRRSFTINYEDAPLSDMTTLEDFYFDDCGNGSAVFNWTRPDTGQVFVVGFKEPMKSSNVAHGFYNITVVLEQR